MRYDHINSQYLHEALDCTSLKKRIDSCVKLLRPKTKKFDAIAFRGMSGALVAPAVAARLKKHLIMVRKEGEMRHSDKLVEGFENTEAYVIIDDFICSGDTINEIKKRVNSKLVGIVCYKWLNWKDVENFRHLNTPIWIAGTQVSLV